MKTLERFFLCCFFCIFALFLWLSVLSQSGWTFLVAEDTHDIIKNGTFAAFLNVQEDEIEEYDIVLLSGKRTARVLSKNEDGSFTASYNDFDKDTFSISAADALGILRFHMNEIGILWNHLGKWHGFLISFPFICLSAGFFMFLLCIRRNTAEGAEYLYEIKDEGKTQIEVEVDLSGMELPLFVKKQMKS